MAFFGRKRSLNQTMLQQQRQYHDNSSSPGNTNGGNKANKLSYSLKGFGSSDCAESGGSSAATKGHGSSNVRKLLKKRYMFLASLAVAVILLLRKNPTTYEMSNVNNVATGGSASAVSTAAASSSSSAANVKNKQMVIANVIRHPTPHKLRTLNQILELWELPCNYVHDGYYIESSNWVLEQVYYELRKLNEDPSVDNTKIIPVIVEVGGHDGITKSLSLSSSRCLKVNTMLVEASPSNYATLQKSRVYDTTINAALCEEGSSVKIYDNMENSGASRIIGDDGKTSTATSSQGIPGSIRNVVPSAQVPCTSLDNELDQMMVTSFGGTSNNDSGMQLKLIFVIMDVEGHEAIAIQGLSKHKPSKVMMETKQLTIDDKKLVDEWSKAHDLKGVECGADGADTCYNFDKHKSYPKEVFYSSRIYNPPNTYQTSDVSKAYRYYGT